MARKASTIDSLTSVFDKSIRPIYAIDAERRIVYCNRALATWLDVEVGRIVGRVVEYHSEPAAESDESRDDVPLTDLCPPPQALAGTACAGTLSCMGRGGRLVHRQADFMPLDGRTGIKAVRGKERAAPATFAVLVMLAPADLSAQELASGVSGEPATDELHRTIRKFRRAQTSRFSIASLLGSSPAMQKVRAQVAAAAASGANALIFGPSGSGRGHVARAIHYSAAKDSDARLVPVDCEVVSDDVLRRVMDGVRASGTGGRPTLLLENLDRLSAAHQMMLVLAISQKTVLARVIATFDDHRPSDTASGEDENGKPIVTPGVDTALLHAISTITIRLPRLADRMEDLPVLSQFFLEACNHGSNNQVGALRSDALDLLALYSWPGELEQLRETIAAAHRACKSHEILPGDLPPTAQHAFLAAKRVRRQPQRIVLDELLASIEKEAIVRALAQAGGNKSEAAGLLGMTRPRLYRRLVQLGLAREEGDDSPLEQPEFIERDPTE